MLSPILTLQFEQLLERYPGAKLTKLPSGASLVEIPDFELPDGWTEKRATVWFVVPIGYPGPALDCFWVESSVRLANGPHPPANANANNMIPETSISALWFSWHVQNWNPNTHDLVTFASIAWKRFEQRR